MISAKKDQNKFLLVWQIKTSIGEDIDAFMPLFNSTILQHFVQIFNKKMNCKIVLVD